MALERNDAKVMRFVLFKDGVPTESADKGTLVIDETNGELYINTSATSPGTTWTKVGTQA